MASSNLSSTGAMNSLEHGIKATIIDFGLSRMDVDISADSRATKSPASATGVQYTKLEEVIFEGEGIYSSIRPYTHLLIQSLAPRGLSIRYLSDDAQNQQKQLGTVHTFHECSGELSIKLSVHTLRLIDEMGLLYQWLHYLVVQLLNAFNLRRPVAPKRSVAPSRSAASFT